MSMNGSGNRWGVVIAGVAVLLAGCSHEAADWKQAGIANSIEAYQLFLQQHPHGTEAPQAQARISQLSEQRDWQVAAAANTRDAYQQFLTQHPSSQSAQEARIRIENFAQAGVTGGVPAPGEDTSAGVAGTAGATAAATATVGGTAGGATSAPAASPPAVAAAPVRSPATHHRLAERTHAGSPAHATRVARVAVGRTVQLGAYRTRASAQSEWKHLEARFASLRGLQPRYVAVHSHGERLYRLQVRLASPAAASGVCATLKRHARSCVRVNA